MGASNENLLKTTCQTICYHAITCINQHQYESPASHPELTQEAEAFIHGEQR